MEKVIDTCVILIIEAINFASKLLGNALGFTEAFNTPGGAL